MGTPPASAPVDQMRNVQRSTCVGRTRPTLSARKVGALGARAWIGSKTSVGFATTAATSTPDPAFMRGWEGSEVRFCEVAQQDLLAQQFFGQVSTLAVEADTQLGLGRRNVVAPSEVATSTDSISLPSISGEN